MNNSKLFILISFLLISFPGFMLGKGIIRPGQIWPDNRGEHINAHGGGVMKYGNTCS